ncbi:MAG: SrfA family protein [Desulfovibrio sp.]|jgi:hypothetical protein|nr:SrfA family protein [Desulfovibrio sp.]
MSSSFIASTPRAGYNAMRYQGILVTDSYAQLRTVLEKNLSPQHALLFAEPMHDASGTTTDWYTAFEGSPIPLDKLSPEKKIHAGEIISKLASDISRLAAQLTQSPEASKNIRGNILSLALRYPDTSHLYMAGDQPIIICWGFEHGSSGAQPEELMRLGAAMAQTPPPPSHPATTTVTPGHAGFNWLRAFLFFLSGMLLLLGLLLCAGLLFSPAASLPAGCAASLRPAGGCSPAPPTPPASSVDSELISSLTAEREKELSLRRLLDDLRREIYRRTAECPREPQVAVPTRKKEEPEPPAPPREEVRIPEPPAGEESDPPMETSPPSLADIMPITPAEPEKPSLPHTEPKTERKAPEKPKPRKQAQGEEMRIPDDAKRNKDVSFLEGCWNSETGLRSDRTHEPIGVQYCFDANGQGTRTITKHQSRDRCVGSVRSRFDSSGRLIIDADGSPCNKGGGFVPELVECSSTDGKADCFGKERGGLQRKWKARFRRS